MTDELTPTQALALWGLLARQGRAPEAEVKPKADRDALVAGGWAEADKPSKTLSLTDRGWNWADTHFDAPLPPAQRPLQDMLVRLGTHLKASGGTLADFIGEAPPLPEPEQKKSAKPPKEPQPPKAPKEPKAPRVRAEPKPKAPPKEKAPPKPKAPTAPVLRQKIEEAYLRISPGGRSQPVPLSKLRAELGDLERKTVDAGLARIMKSKTETASLSQISDNKAIDAAEREAAYVSAGESFHLIRIT